MEELNFNDASCLNRGNMSLNCTMGAITLDPLSVKILNWMNWISISIGLPLIFIVMIAIFFQVKKGQEAPVYVINLLISDLIQLFSRIPVDLCRLSQTDFTYMKIVYACIKASVGFMVCISCERYLVVAMPMWYRFRRNIKTYVVVCIVVWLLPLFYPLIAYVFKEYGMAAHFFIAFLLLPIPLFIFFLVGTIKALSGAVSVPADEKRRLAAIQVVVLIIYTLLYLPIILLLLYDINAFKGELSCIPYSVGYAAGALSPLADTTLYVFFRKSILDTFLASLSCCKISSN
ncbi:G-protein coupled receptor 4-like [Xiphophorus couchianus]|uniref:G-protein coupled receptor 4-like n=1 Tax=Xiphophorus couchianus TaxID=32473 RepID=UPI0010170918|nr:G-protein coupled receptor 4-like [Xiphophorus couchianus]